MDQSLLVLTESSMAGADRKVYQFEVNRKATKTDVKVAVADVFGVTVKKVNIANVRGKNKRMGRYQGLTRNRKKATVSLTADSKDIEVFKNQEENK
ncbi:50S ribosomal protein L23 [Oenococcus oeni]|uniref:50S ribosomal protein L23 n=1 Tax=Oenococcus oeni TaxID=1247 RepID=UPI0008F92448|nr:50S ribosomal protein L23 [Oenococcus oeni]OIM09319.1 50S ribosomal protein L23 [Oenococcus oeni]